MDEIQTRLQETSQNCLNAYTEWESKKKDRKAQEELSSAIHELRKVSSRLEIELAVSERDQATSKPLPIPSHRANSKGVRSQQQKDDNAAGDSESAPAAPKMEIKRRRTRKPAEGSSDT